MRRGTHQRLVLREFASVPSGLIASEAASRAGVRGGWKRVSDLKAKGLIEPTGATRADPTTGRQSEVLAITLVGQRALGEKPE